MNTIFTNEKLGRSVENLRLREIQQQVEWQRIAQSARTVWFKQMGRRFSAPIVLMTHLFTR
jgi:hypothetical protein